MNNRIISAFLLVIMLLTCFITGCNTSDSQVETVTTNDETFTEKQMYDQNGFLNDSLPENIDLNNDTVSIYVRGDTYNQYYAEQTGDIVDDAIYLKNCKIEERLNVKLNIFHNTTDDFWGDRETYINTVRASVLSNDGTIDIAVGLSNIMPVLVQDGMFYNLLERDTKYLDFDKPWWPADLTNELSVKDRMYLVSGDADLGVIKYMVGIFFNKNLIEDYKLDDPYELVLNGTWTLDKLEEMATSIYSDLNGNSTIDADDQFGFIMDNDNHSTLFVLSSGLSFTEINDQGLPEYNLGTEKIFDLFDQISNMMKKEGFICNNSMSPGIECGNAFSDGRALFTTGEFKYAETYRDLNFDYGILPYPKYDESQSNYYSGVRATYSLMGITITANKDNATAVLEACASENYRSVIPVYFEEALKVKYSRDDMSSQMFDVIKNGVKFDLGIILGPLMGAAITTDVRNELSFGKGNWASTWASKKASANQAIKEYFDIITALEN